jgi:hypothetical protein
MFALQRGVRAVRRSIRDASRANKIHAGDIVVPASACRDSFVESAFRFAESPAVSS